jgi:glycine/D-amino acid oxidase-like deaminating enzyme
VTLQLFDIAIAGGGLAGLASALAIRKIAPQLRVVLIGSGGRSGARDFASNQPAIATHPHFSLDHNFLSQWTCFALPFADTYLNEAVRKNPAVQLARGRWQLAQSNADAARLKRLLDVFNRKVIASQAAMWMADKTQFGAVWMPSAWAVNPSALQRVWLNDLADVEFIDDSVSALNRERNNTVHLKTALGQKIQANLAIIAHAGLLPTLFKFEGNISADAAMPLTRWPGHSQYDANRQQCDVRTMQFGRRIVQTKRYALPLEGNEWLISGQGSEHTTTQFAGNRWHASDRLPYVGTMWNVDQTIVEKIALAKYPSRVLPRYKNILLNTAHGSRGLLGAIAGAEVSAALAGDLLLGTNSFPKLGLSASLCAAINPDRYIKRLLRNLQ